MPREKLLLWPQRIPPSSPTTNLKELRECAPRPTRNKIIKQCVKAKGKSSINSLKPESQNGQTPFRLSERGKNSKESRDLKTMRLPEERLMPRKKLTNNNCDKSNWIKLIRCSMTTRIWLRPFTVKCFSAMSTLSRTFKERQRSEDKTSKEKSTANGRSSRNKRCLNMMKDSEKSLRRSIIRK